MPDFDELKSQKREFKIKVDNREEGYFYVWEPDKFANRIYMMRDKYNEYVDNLGKIPDFSNKEEDPFWDSPEPVLIGKSYLGLASLVYSLDDALELKVFSTNTAFASGECGTINVGYEACNAEGGPPPDEFLEVEDAQEMLGKEIFFKVNVDKCDNLPMELCTNVYCEYIFKHEPENVYRTDVFSGKNPNPVFNYQKLHNVECINDYILDYFNNGHIVFKTYGNPAFGGQITPNKAPVVQRSNPASNANSFVAPAAGAGAGAAASAPSAPAAAAKASTSSAPASGNVAAAAGAKAPAGGAPTGVAVSPVVAADGK